MAETIANPLTENGEDKEPIDQPFNNDDDFGNGSGEEELDNDDDEEPKHRAVSPPNIGREMADSCISPTYGG